MLRVRPLYARLDVIYDQWGEQVDAILGGLDTPAERLSVIEEMGRQLGALQGELGDREKAIRKAMDHVEE
jgi:hypothetical protein